LEADTLSSLAQQIADKTFINHTAVWCMLISISLVVSFFGGLIGGYAGKRGQNLATKADFDQLLEQTRRTTDHVSRINSAISLGEWTQKEFRTLRRTKLEELMLAVDADVDWIEREHHRIAYESSPDKEAAPIESPPINRATIICLLYFPELVEQFDHVRSAHHSFILWLRKWRAEVIERKQNGLFWDEAYKELHQKQRREFGPLYKGLFDSARKMAEAARPLMTAVITPGDEAR